MQAIDIVTQGETAISQCKGYYEGYYHDATYLELAVIALGKTHCPDVLPYLSTILKTQMIPSTYNTHCVHADACEAIQEIGDKCGSVILRECLRNPEFQAITYAFRALCSLGEPKEAITLAIRRITPEIKGKWNELIIRELEEITGQHFGFAQEAWQQWWEQEEKTWESKK